MTYDVTLITPYHKNGYTTSNHISPPRWMMGVGYLSDRFATVNSVKPDPSKTKPKPKIVRKYNEYN